MKSLFKSSISILFIICLVSFSSYYSCADEPQSVKMPSHKEVMQSIEKSTDLGHLTGMHKNKSLPAQAVKLMEQEKELFQTIRDTLANNPDLKIDELEFGGILEQNKNFIQICIGYCIRTDEICAIMKVYARHFKELLNAELLAAKDK